MFEFTQSSLYVLAFFAYILQNLIYAIWKRATKGKAFPIHGFILGVGVSFALILGVNIAQGYFVINDFNKLSSEFFVVLPISQTVYTLSKALGDVFKKKEAELA